MKHHLHLLVQQFYLCAAADSLRVSPAIVSARRVSDLQDTTTVQCTGCALYTPLQIQCTQLSTYECRTSLDLDSFSVYC